MTLKETVSPVPLQGRNGKYINSADTAFQRTESPLNHISKETSWNIFLHVERTVVRIL